MTPLYKSNELLYSYNGQDTYNETCLFCIHCTLYPRKSKITFTRHMSVECSEGVKWKLGLETGIGLFLPLGKWDLSPWDWQLVTGDEKNGNEIKISSHHFFVNFEHVYPDPACTELITISRLQNDIKYGGILIPSSWILVYRNTF